MWSRWVLGCLGFDIQVLGYGWQQIGIGRNHVNSWEKLVPDGNMTQTNTGTTQTPGTGPKKGDWGLGLLESTHLHHWWPLLAKFGFWAHCTTMGPPSGHGTNPLYRSKNYSGSLHWLQGQGFGAFFGLGKKFFSCALRYILRFMVFSPLCKGENVLGI